MKTITMFSAILVASASLAAPSAAPLEVGQRASSAGFGVIASRSTSPIHLRSLAANAGAIWIGRNTSSYCPFAADSGTCPAGTSTSFVGGNDTLSMNVVVPGGQQVYVGLKGALHYTQAHSATMPKGSIVTGFTKTPVKGQNYDILSHKDGLFACTTKDDSVYKIFVGVQGFSKKDCLGFDGIAANVAGAGAWQYT